MLNLDDIRVIEKYDSSGMLTTLEAFPEQCRAAVTIGRKFMPAKSIKRKYSNVVYTGLGGSAIGGELLRAYISREARIPMIVNRNYTLPGFVGKDSLVIVSSYSGNTEETISAYKDARRRSAGVLVVTSGGELHKMAVKDDLPVILIPKGFQPRCALGYSFFPILISLANLGMIADRARDIDEAIGIMSSLRSEKIGHAIALSSNPAKFLAGQLYAKIPVIYASQDHMDSVATRWRAQIAENSKTLSSTHSFPEMNHNEIVGWKNPKGLSRNFAVVILRDKDDHPGNSRRMEITRDILRRANIRVMDVKSVGKTLLGRIFSLVYTGDFASYYLSILNAEDPTPVDRIAYLKEKLAGR